MSSRLFRARVKRRTQREIEIIKTTTEIQKRIFFENTLVLQK